MDVFFRSFDSIVRRIAHIQSGWQTVSFVQHKGVETFRDVGFPRAPVVPAPVAAAGVGAGKSDPIAVFLGGALVFFGVFAQNF